MTKEVETLGRYRVLSEIGRGAHATVHLGEDKDLGRRVALKVFTTVPGIKDPAVAARFQREVAALSRMQSSGVCRIFETGCASGSPWIAMSLVEGRTLADHLENRRRPNTDSSTQSASSELQTRLDRSGIVAAIAAAARSLHDVHNAGVVHGDLKPSNLMLTPGGGCVIIDFGVSWLAAERYPRSDRGGTLPYLAPECLGDGGSVASDIWSLGVTLYEALAGKLPFFGPTRDRLVAAILTGDPPDLTSGAGGVNRDVAAVVERCLARDPNRRFANALELAEELERCARGEPVFSRRLSTFGRLVRSAQRHKALGFLAVFVPAALAVGLLLVLASRREENRLLVLTAEAADEAREKSAEGARLLAGFLELSDIQRIVDLDRRSSRLWPPRPEIVPELERWLTDAAPLAAQIDERRQALESLRSRARRQVSAARSSSAPALARETEEVQEAMAALSARALETSDDPRAAARIESALESAEQMLESLRKEINATTLWEYDDAGLTLKDQTLTRIVAGLEHLNGSDPHRASITGVRGRIAASQDLRAKSIDSERETWDRALKSIANVQECPDYAGLSMAAQTGLVPLGRNSKSGLWEFHHLATGGRPLQDAAGSWVVGESSGVVLVLIPGGRAMLGAQLPNARHPLGSPFIEEAAEAMEGPVHGLDLAPYFVSKYEMTQGQWLRASGLNPSDFAPPKNRASERANLAHPVELVSWREVAEVLWHLGLELPTEAQWEHAARGGTTGPRWTGEDLRSLEGAVNAADLTRRAASPTARTPDWFDDGYAYHAPVGSFRPNPFGLHDVYGNVWEWCNDAFNSYHEAVFAEQNGELLGLDVGQRVYRGGSAATPLPVLRSAKRNAAPPSSRLIDLGVRPARKVE